MRKLILLLPLLFVAEMFSQSDLPIIGDIAEIKGRTKIYVAVEAADDRKLILKEFTKNKTFTVVNDPADAEFFMTMRSLSKVDKTVMFGRDYEERDEAQVYYIRADGKKIVVWQDTETYTAPSGMIVSMPNSMNLTRNFLKAYKKMLKTAQK